MKVLALITSLLTPPSEFSTVDAVFGQLFVLWLDQQVLPIMSGQTPDAQDLCTTPETLPLRVYVLVPAGPDSPLYRDSETIIQAAADAGDKVLQTIAGAL